MRNRIAPLLLLLTSACVVPAHGGDRPPWPDEPLRSVDFSIGPMILEDDAFGNLDQAATVGVEISEDYGLAPFFLEGGLRYGFDRDRRRLSNGDSVVSELSILQLSAGLRLELPVERRSLVPYAGAGANVSFLTVNVDDLDDDDDADTAFGVYWKLGLALPLSHSTHVAFEVRGVEGGSVSTSAFDADIDSTQLALVFGLSF
jgi:hypothetical protein